MFEAWFSDPVSAGWLLLAAVGLILLLAVASRMNRDPLEGRPDVFHGTEPGPEDRGPRAKDVRGQAAPYGLDAGEVEDRDTGAGRS